MNTQKKLLNQIKNAISDSFPHAEIILFGSRARGDSRPDSDWDVLILLNKAKVEFLEKRLIRKRIYKVELDTGQPISVFVFSLNEWYLDQKNTPLFESVETEGVHL